MEGLEKYDKIYQETESIIGCPYYDMGAVVGRSKKVGDKELKELNEYSQQFLEEENRGILRTILIILKPYRNNEIIQDTFTKLADKLRAGSSTGKI
jgi:hypothetical protein